MRFAKLFDSRPFFSSLLLTLIMSLAALYATRAEAMVSVPTFDPAAPYDFDMSWGSERPDAEALARAFTAAYEGFDRCVTKQKRRSGNPEKLDGDLHLAILLEPGGGPPRGVNAELPPSHAKAQQLRECVREAAAVDFPAYDGPPVVYEVEVELDPGFIEVES